MTNTMSKWLIFTAMMVTMEKILARLEKVEGRPDPDSRSEDSTPSSYARVGSPTAPRPRSVGSSTI